MLPKNIIVNEEPKPTTLLAYEIFACWHPESFFDKFAPELLTQSFIIVQYEPQMTGFADDLSASSSLIDFEYSECRSNLSKKIGSSPTTKPKTLAIMWY